MRASVVAESLSLASGEVPSRFISCCARAGCLGSTTGNAWHKREPRRYSGGFRVGDVVDIVLHKGELSFAVNGDNKGVAFT